jgi:hypothetical protein
MPNPPKCFLLPIDGTAESLRPVEFLVRLYPGVLDVNLIISYFLPPLPPLYSDTAFKSSDLAKKRQEVQHWHERDARRIFDAARKVLLEAGFSEELIQEHVQQREMTVARHACLLADLKKVDAVLVQKRVGSSLEGFLKDDPTSALLRHCLVSPVWFTDGEIEAANAAVCVNAEDATLRIADHAGYMLSGTASSVTLLHATASVSAPVSCMFSEAQSALGPWLLTAAGRAVMPFLLKSARLIRDNGMDEDRIRLALIPNRGNLAQGILGWAQENGVGILGLGHSQPQGTWSFLKVSVTRKILEDFRNMAVWVAQ